MIEHVVMATVYGILTFFIPFVFFVDTSSRLRISNLIYWFVMFLFTASMLIKFLEHYQEVIKIEKTLDKSEKSDIIVKSQGNSDKNLLK